MSKSESKKTFLVAPLRVKPLANARENAMQYDHIKRTFSSLARELRPAGGIGRLFSEMDIGGSTSFGTVVDFDKLSERVTSRPDQMLQTLHGLYLVVDSRKERASHDEALAVVKQLKELGHTVVVEKDSNPNAQRFFGEAVQAGAVPKKPEEIDDSRREHLRAALEGVYTGFMWARDRHVLIDGKIEKPVIDMQALKGKLQHFFGEGGMMVQVGPKEWVVNKNVLKDPRVAKYTAAGHIFYSMPDGLLYDRSFSDVFGEPVYSQAAHIDTSIGAVPELKVVAVCPHYRSQNRLSVDLMQGNLGVKVVEVPKDEAHRNPANFLPLGNGKALVDSGAPKFIELLRKAGVDVIPTAKPLNDLLIHKGGLHCLFNEL